MTVTSTRNVRENTIVHQLGVRRLALASHTRIEPADLDALVAQAIGALPDKVERLKTYLTAIGYDPSYTKRITHLTHGGGGELEVEITDFKYSANPATFNPTVVAQSVFNNSTNAELTEQFSCSKSTTDTFTFKFTEGLKIGTSAKFKAGLPIIGEGEVSVSGEVSFSAEQAWTTTESKTWNATFSVKVPAQQKIRVTASLGLAQVNASFTCTARVTGCRAYLVGTGNDTNDACVDVVVPLAAFFPDPAELPSAPLAGTLTGTEGVSLVVLTENI